MRIDKRYNISDEQDPRCQVEFNEKNESELFQLMRNVTSGKMNEKGKATSFMEEWIKDPNMLTAHRLANIPYNGTYDKSKRLMNIGSETVLNIFQGYNPVIKTEFKNKQILIKEWYNLAQEMCEGGNKDPKLKEKMFYIFLETY